MKKDDTTVTLTGADGFSTGPMPADEFAKRVGKVAKHIAAGGSVDDFALEPTDPDAGQISEAVIAELRHARAVAKDYAQGYSEACKAQAEKYKLKPSALKRYIAALEDDKLDDLDAETSDIEKLMA